MSPLWTAQEIAAATQGHSQGDWMVTGVSIDSRTIQPGELFVALVGPTHDGHDHVAGALEAGAAGALVARQPGDVAAERLVEVADTQRALEDLGRAARARFQGRLIGITGSVGKTGTKTALAKGLAGFGRVHASAKSHNNHWGVPLTLANLPADADFAVSEMGMNHAGEIRALTQQVRPHGCLITAIAPAHLGHFQDVAGIADAKAEIFEGVVAGGFAVIPADSDYTEQLRAAATRAGVETVYTFGAGGDAVATDVKAGSGGTQFQADVAGQRLAVSLPVPGKHWVSNTLGLLQVAAALDVDLHRFAEALRHLEPEVGRGRRYRIPTARGHATLIDDSYNANPASMRAALGVLELESGRRLAALGDMRELGVRSAELHSALAAPVMQAGCSRVFTVGGDMAHLANALPDAVRGAHADHASDLLGAIRAELRADDTLLVKGSLASGMGALVRGLLEAEAA